MFKRQLTGNLMTVDLTNMVEEAVNACDLELYDTSMSRAQSGRVLRVKIDSKNGVSAEDCALTARHLRYHLSAQSEDFDDVQIEVSSPGIERPLKQLKHYVSSIGKMVSITFMDQERKYHKTSGVLQKALDNTITLKTTQGIETLLLENITKAHVVFQPPGAHNE
ncbi:MAG TPA: hypothetical protein QF353_01440 [Gammaproteobacteria bacterium]|nr:hypothetical protein [Gammaproteobacteria bacterium]